MADNYKRLARASFFIATTTTVYGPVGAGVTTLVKKIQVSNNSVLSGTVKIHHVQSGGVADATNVILPTTTLGPNEQGTDDATFVMETGDTLQVFGDGTAGHVISISAYGLELS
jgi:hypothetical protein